MQAFISHYIADNWIAAQSSEIFKVHDSNTEEVIATVEAGTVEETNRALVAAKGAFDTWCTQPADTRAAYLDKISAGLKTRMDEIARVIARNSPNALNCRQQ